MLTIGCHLSTTKGYRAMGETALSIGANTFAFFTRNPRGGKAKDLDMDDVAALRELMAQNDFGPLVAHAPYTYNPCSAKERAREFALEAMAEDLRRMEALPGNYYNFHPGAHVGAGPEAAIKQIIKGLNEIIDPNQKVTIALETMAGKGTEIGRSFDELAAIIDGVTHNEKLRVTFDTCHTNDAGYDIKNDFDGVLNEFDHIIGLDRLSVIHVNDSKNPQGSHKDRHANIGFGTIGFDALNKIAHHPALAELPKILETPYVGPDKKHQVPPYGAEIKWLKTGDFQPDELRHLMV